MTQPIYRLPGFNVLLEGPSGTGKTFSIGTLVATGLEVFYLDLDPGLESLLGYFTDYGKPIPPNLHWHRLAEPPEGIAALGAKAQELATKPLEFLMKQIDPSRHQRNRWFDLFAQLNDFVDENTGEAFGCVDTWGPDRVLVIDGLTGLTRIAADPIIGKKIAKTQPEIGKIQDVIQELLRQLTNGCRCHFVLIGHVDRILDEVLGGMTILPSTEGKKLAPKLPAMFSDVILAKRAGASWLWSTSDSGVDLKTRNLTYSDKLPPSFGPLVAKWKSRAIEGDTK